MKTEVDIPDGYLQPGECLRLIPVPEGLEISKQALRFKRVTVEPDKWAEENLPKLPQSCGERFVFRHADRWYYVSQRPTVTNLPLFWIDEITDTDYIATEVTTVGTEVWVPPVYDGYYAWLPTERQWIWLGLSEKTMITNPDEWKQLNLWAERNLPKPPTTVSVVMAVDDTNSWFSFSEPPTLNQKYGGWDPPSLDRDSDKDQQPLELDDEVNSNLIGKEEFKGAWSTGYFVWSGGKWQWTLIASRDESRVAHSGQKDPLFNEEAWAKKYLSDEDPRRHDAAHKWAAMDQEGAWYAYGGQIEPSYMDYSWELTNEADDGIELILDEEAPQGEWPHDWDDGYFEWHKKKWIWMVYCKP